MCFPMVITNSTIKIHIDNSITMTFLSFISTHIYTCVHVLILMQSFKIKKKIVVFFFQNIFSFYHWEQTIRKILTAWKYFPLTTFEIEVQQQLKRSGICFLCDQNNALHCLQWSLLWFVWEVRLMTITSVFLSGEAAILLKLFKMY